MPLGWSLEVVHTLPAGTMPCGRPPLERLSFACFDKNLGRWKSPSEMLKRSQLQTEKSGGCVDARFIWIVERESYGETTDWTEVEFCLNYSHDDNWPDKSQRKNWQWKVKRKTNTPFRTNRDQSMVKVMDCRYNLIVASLIDRCAPKLIWYSRIYIRTQMEK